ncbi:Protein transport protein SEC31-like B [Porphyridium purpureum]|uniref:Protein transport protein SEC31-like B n=1 Tax=Porphyridium purpureum TaxID=35688 RepID=A0A5J4YWU5_PORPP|nr:Protein transport protein SEC31-like B [Porphyridium purpureum]|eukprot:POR8541..scf227_4
MGVVAEVDRCAFVAWRDAGALAAASSHAMLATGVLDGTYSAGGGQNVEVMQLRADRRRLETLATMPLAGRTCHALAYGASDLLAAGLNDGTVCLWDAGKAVRSSNRSPDAGPDASGALLFSSNTLKRTHASAVRSLEFNPAVKTLLASGGADGEILVWDMHDNVASPAVHAPAAAAAAAARAKSGAGGAGSDTHPSGIAPTAAASAMAGADEITAVQWNRKVQHILGSVASNGLCVIWDLRQKKAVTSIRSGRRRCSALAWSPDVATQLILACDDEMATSPALKLWDLRNPNNSIREYAHQASGVSSLSWSPHDSDFVVSAGKDGSTVVFSASTGGLLTELPRSQSSTIFHVRWAPTLPGTLSCSSLGGSVSIHSMLAAPCSADTFEGGDGSGGKNASIAAAFGVDAADFALPEDALGLASDADEKSVSTGNVVDLSARAPKWLMKRCRVSFGFGGRMVATRYPPNPAKGSPPDAEQTVHMSRRSVEVSNVPVEAAAVVKHDELLQKVAELDDALARATASPKAAAAFCATFEAESGTNTLEKTSWEFLRIHFELDPRSKLTEKLGYKHKISSSGGTSSSRRGENATYGLSRAPPLREVDKPPAGTEMDISTGSAALGEGADPGTAASSSYDPLADDLAGLAAPWETEDADGSLLDAAPSDEGPEDKQATRQAAAIPAQQVGVDTQVQACITVGDFESAVELCIGNGEFAEALVLARAGGPALWSSTMQRYLEQHAHAAFRVVLRGVVTSGEMSSVLDGCADWREALALISTYSDSAGEFSAQAERLGMKLCTQGEVRGAVAAFVSALSARRCMPLWYKESISAAKGNRLAALLSLSRRVRMCAAARALAQGGVVDMASRDVLSKSGSEDASSLSVLVELAYELGSVGALEAAARCVQYVPGGIPSVHGTSDEVRMFIQVMQGVIANAAKVAAMEQQQKEMRERQQYQQQQQQQQYQYSQRQQAPQAHQMYAGSNGFAAGPPSAMMMQPTAPVPARAVGGPPLPSAPGFTIMQPAQQQSAPPGMSAPPPSLRSGAVVQPPPSGPPTGLPPAPQLQTPVMPSMPPTTQVRLPAPPAPPSKPSMTPPVVMPLQMPMMPPPPGTGGAPPVAQHVAPPPGMVPPPAQHMPMMPSATGSHPGMSTASSTSSLSSLTASSAVPLPTGDGTPTGGRRLPQSAEVAGLVQSQNERRPVTVKEPSVTIEEADVSSVPAEQMAIVQGLRQAVSHAAALNSTGIYAKKMDDLSRRLGKLLQMLNRGELSESIIGKLSELCTALGGGDLVRVGDVIKRLTAENWENNAAWIMALKRLVEMLKTGR